MVAGHTEAPFGIGSARTSVWVTPSRSVARACRVWLPAARVKSVREVRQSARSTGGQLRGLPRCAVDADLDLDLADAGARNGDGTGQSNAASG
jgi:hypothetical protein